MHMLHGEMHESMYSRELLNAYFDQAKCCSGWFTFGILVVMAVYAYIKFVFYVCIS